MAQEAVRRDELANSFDVFSTWVQGAAVVPLSVTVNPATSSFVTERIECRLMVGLFDYSNAADNSKLGIPTTRLTAPWGLYWQEGGCIVGMVSGIGAFSYNNSYVNLAAPGQPMDFTLHLRNPRRIDSMTLSLVSPSTSAGTNPDFISINAATGSTQVKLMAHFTFFGPRDTRMYM